MHFDNVADETAKAKHPDWPTFSCDDGFAETAPVASFRPNGFQLYDLGGNVLEWCWDWYGDYPRDGAADPTGPTTGEACVLRGGS